MASQADTEPMDYGGDHEFSASQRAFVVEHKLAGRKYPSISRRFQEKYGIEAPTRRHVYNLVKKLKTKYTLLDQRKGKKGHPLGWFSMRSLTSRNGPGCVSRLTADTSSRGCKSPLLHSSAPHKTNQPFSGLPNFSKRDNLSNLFHKQSSE